MKKKVGEQTKKVMTPAKNSVILEKQKYHSLYNDIIQIQQQLHVCKVHLNRAEVKLNEQSVIFAFSESPEKALQAKLEDLFHIYLEIQDSRSCKKLF